MLGTIGLDEARNLALGRDLTEFDSSNEFFRFPTELILNYSYPFIGGSGNKFLENYIDRYNLSLDFETSPRTHIIQNNRHFFKDTNKSLFLNYEDIPVGLIGFKTYFNVCYVLQIQATKQNAEIYASGAGLMSAQTHNDYLKGFDWRAVLLNSLEIILSQSNGVRYFEILKNKSRINSNKFYSLEKAARSLGYDFESDEDYIVKEI